VVGLRVLAFISIPRTQKKKKKNQKQPTTTTKNPSKFKD
jgi:hypothetical protein